MRDHRADGGERRDSGSCQWYDPGGGIVDRQHFESGLRRGDVDPVGNVEREDHATVEVGCRREREHACYSVEGQRARHRVSGDLPDDDGCRGHRQYIAIGIGRAGQKLSGRERERCGIFQDADGAEGLGDAIDDNALKVEAEDGGRVGDDGSAERTTTSAAANRGRSGDDGFDRTHVVLEADQGAHVQAGFCVGQRKGRSGDRSELICHHVLNIGEDARSWRQLNLPENGELGGFSIRTGEDRKTVGIHHAGERGRQN